MQLDKVLKHFDVNTVGLADMLGMSQPAISNWRRRGRIPHLQQLRIAELSGGVLKVDQEYRIKPVRSAKKS